MNEESRIQNFRAVNQAVGLQDAENFFEDPDGILDVLKDPAEKGAIETIFRERKVKRIAFLNGNAAILNIVRELFFRALNLRVGGIDALDGQVGKTPKQDLRLCARPAPDFQNFVLLGKVDVLVDGLLKEAGLLEQSLLLFRRISVQIAWSDTAGAHELHLPILR